MRAAKVKRVRPLTFDSTEIWLDLGSDALLTKKWYAALIDENGHPLMEWVHLDWVAKWDCAMTVPFNNNRIDEESARVALIQELPK